jgi:hypothetical protein
MKLLLINSSETKSAIVSNGITQLGEIASEMIMGTVAPIHGPI